MHRGLYGPLFYRVPKILRLWAESPLLYAEFVLHKFFAQWV